MPLLGIFWFIGLGWYPQVGSDRAGHRFNGRAPVVPIAIAADGTNRAALHRVKTLGQLLRRLGLLEHVEVRLLVIAPEVLRCNAGAQIVVEAHIIDVEAPWNIARKSMLEAGH